jgi:hydrogenase expression/formation protein HypC
MCLSVPVKVEEVRGETALVSFGGIEYNANISLLDEVTKGDYLLLHAGFAIQKISETHARETLDLIHEMNQHKNQT